MRKLQNSLISFTQTAKQPMEILLSITPDEKLTADDFAAIKAAADKLNITSEEFVVAAVADALKREELATAAA